MYVHEIKLEGNDKFSEQFNACSDIFQEYMESVDEQKKSQLWEQFLVERWRLESGSY